jgi:hypothetical protein
LRQILEENRESTVNTCHLFIDFNAVYDGKGRNKFRGNGSVLNTKETWLNFTKLHWENHSAEPE